MIPLLAGACIGCFVGMFVGWTLRSLEDRPAPQLRVVTEPSNLRVIHGDVDGAA